MFTLKVSMSLKPNQHSSKRLLRSRIGKSDFIALDFVMCFMKSAVKLLLNVSCCIFFCLSLLDLCVLYRLFFRDHLISHPQVEIKKEIQTTTSYEFYGTKIYDDDNSDNNTAKYMSFIRFPVNSSSFF